MNRYTPKGVWAEQYSDQERSDIISQILGDDFYMEHLTPAIIRGLRSTDIKYRNNGLISVHKFEDHIEFLGGREAFVASKQAAEPKPEPTKPQPTPQQQLAASARKREENDRAYAQKLLGLASLPNEFKPKLGSPKIQTIRKGLELAKAWLAEQKAQREAAIKHDEQIALGETLRPLLDQAEQLFSDIETLVGQDLTPERRMKLQELLDTNEDCCNNPIRLTSWIDKAQLELGRTTRKLAKAEAETPKPAGPNWELLDKRDAALPTGNPNAQGIGTIARGQVVGGAGKKSSQRGKKGGKK